MFSILIKGGVLMVPIIIASIISVTLIIERILFWRRQRSEVSESEIIGLVDGGRFDEALAKIDAYPSPILRVLKAGIRHRDPNPALAMEAQAIKEIKEMNRFLPALDTIITLAPLLGLLGTIIGMIQAFGIISEAGLGQPMAVTGGIAEALIATAAGITVAITTLIPYNYFLSRTEKATDDIERHATRLEMAFMARHENGDKQGFMALN